MSLADVDLVRTACPKGTTIAIEGVCQYCLTSPHKNLLEGIVYVWYEFKNEVVGNNKHFMHRITLLEFDAGKKLVKVRIAAHQQSTP